MGPRLVLGPSALAEGQSNGSTLCSNMVDMSPMAGTMEGPKSYRGACLCWSKEWRLLHAQPQWSHPLICIQAAAGAWRTVTLVSVVRTEMQSKAVSVYGPWASASVSPRSSLEMQMPDSTPVGLNWSLHSNKTPGDSQQCGHLSTALDQAGQWVPPSSSCTRDKWCWWRAKNVLRNPDVNTEI